MSTRVVTCASLLPSRRRYAGPGAKLAVGRDPPGSRDGRLQTWAGDMFGQLASQRQDLRRTRVELAGMQQARRGLLLCCFELFGAGVCC